MSFQPLLVSIVVTSYNYGRYLPAAIDSALQQTYPHVEVIVVDDGSTDDSPAIIRAYGDAVRAIFQPNGGQASATNAGFAASRGDLVLFLDSDDALHPDAIARVVAAWRPGLAKIQFRLAVVDAAGAPTGRQLPPAAYRLPDGSVKAAVLGGRYYPSPPTSGNVYPRAVLARLMPIPAAWASIYTDTYFLTLACLMGEVASIEEPCGAYRVHGTNLSEVGHAALTLSWLEKSAAQALRRAELVRTWAAAEGLETGPHLAYRYPGEMARWMALKLLAPDHPLVNGLGRNWLAVQGMVAIATEAHPTRLVKRLAGAAWFALAALLPRSAAMWLTKRALAGQTHATTPLATRRA